MKLSLTGIMVEGMLPEEKKLHESGMLTDCTTLARSIAECEDDDLILNVNSYGGSVEGGRSLAIAISDYVNSHPKATLSVEIGAICASAAANLVATLPAKADVRVHRQSMMMFHSCAGLVEGTPDELRDSAHRMDLYNGMIKDALKSSTSLDADAIDQWFESGREGWLSGSEAVECGLANGFSEDTTTYEPMPVLPDGDGVNQRYAACVAVSQKCREKAMEDEKKELELNAQAEETALKAEAEDLEKKDLEEKEPEQAEAEVEAECGDNDTKAEEDETEAEGEETEETDDSEELIEALKQENEALKAELAEVKATCEKLTAGLKTPKHATEPTKTFAQLVKEIPTDLTEREYARRFTALKEAHKAEYDAYLDAHRRH